MKTFARDSPSVFLTKPYSGFLNSNTEVRKQANKTTKKPPNLLLPPAAANSWNSSERATQV